MVRLAPAEAMRPPAPLQYRAGWLDRVLGLRLLSARRRITLRGITGRPIRAALTVLGVALAVPVILVSRFWNDALDYMMDVQFEAVDRGDVTVTFTDPVSAAAQWEIARMPGVLLTEGFRGVPVRLRRRAPLLPHGDPRPAARTARCAGRWTATLRPIPLPPDGVLLSQRLAERLHVRPGGHIRLEVLEGERPVRDVPIAGLADDMIGLNVYMRLGALNRLMREGDTISGVGPAHRRPPRRRAVPRPESRAPRWKPSRSRPWPCSFSAPPRWCSCWSWPASSPCSPP